MKINRFAAAVSVVELLLAMATGWYMFHWKGAALVFIGGFCMWWGFVCCAEKTVEEEPDPEHDSDNGFELLEEKD